MPQDVVNQKETPLAVDSGMYMQTVQQETADALKEYSTFDKAGMTMHAIREERTRLSSMVKELSKTKDEREKNAVQPIMDTYFPNETDNTKKEVLQELFAGGVDRLGDNAQEMLSNAKTTWGDITGYEQYTDYDPKNPPESTSDTTEWYNEAKQAYGHNPNKRELYDVAHKEYVKELQDKSRASLEEEKQQITQAMDDASQNGDTDTYTTLQEQNYASGTDGSGEPEAVRSGYESSCRRYRQKESRSPGRHKKHPEQSRA